MTLDEIKAAVDAGQTVHWANTGYVVHKDRLGQYLITYVPNGIAQSKDAAENPGSQSRPDVQGRGVAPGGAGASPLGRQL